MLAALALVAGACGTRRSHTDVVAAARGSARLGSAQGAATGGDELGGDQGGLTGGDQGAAGSAGGASAGGANSTGAVGSGASGTGAGSGTQAAGAASGGAKSTINIGVVGTLSGVAGASLGPQADGVRVWARWINDRGGVNGHKVNVLVADDGGDPSRHLSLVQEFVEQRHVIAFVGNPEALSGNSSVAYLTKAGVPEIGSEGAAEYFYQSPVYFPQGSHGKALGQAALLGYSTVAKAKGFTKVATITCVEVQVCRDSYGTAKAGFAKYGMQVVYQSQNSLGQPDFTSECLNARSAGAQFLSVAMDANSVKNIARSCARQAYHPMIGISSGQTTPDLKDVPELDGTVIASLAGPWTDNGTPGVREFLNAMAKYAPSLEPIGGHMIGWAAGQLFGLGARQLGEPGTGKAVIDALQGVRGDPFPDTDGQMLFNRGAPASPTVCVFTILIKNKGWSPVPGRPCAPYDPNL